MTNQLSSFKGVTTIQTIEVSRAARSHMKALPTIKITSLALLATDSINIAIGIEKAMKSDPNITSSPILNIEPGSPQQQQ
eukprot:m.334410 g.334410  ORF g.334410 m.334410 type:complete len:80 (-) comp17345_c0_seq1:95-334(-)